MLPKLQHAIHLKIYWCLTDVRDKHLIVNAQKKCHDVPRETLCRYLATKTTMKAKLGHKAALKKVRKVNCFQEFSIWLKLDTLIRPKHSYRMCISDENRILLFFFESFCLSLLAERHSGKEPRS